ncbi:LLM class flavin-dependent oxidoreductase [Pseudonocardia sp. NPDC046786]|uniref:LLM class flavin-dependent oxidoreductase n=1 Tax=Pseudonocardia sp. NPDC046786 TaxID=3155471 RepID=UPI0033D98EB0
MTIALHWYLPTAGDGRTLVDAGQAAQLLGAGGRTDTGRPATVEYLAAVAAAAERAGFDAVLTPTGTYCEDAWITTAMLSQHVSRLRFLVAFRPGTLTPTLAAQQAATYQRLTGGRLALNVVTGGEDAEQRRFGDGLGKDDRYARTAEFLTVLRGAWSGTPFDFRGEHLWAEGALARGTPEPPPVYLGGASPAAVAVAARHADVYLVWGAPPDQVAAQLAQVRSAAAAHGRTVRFGIRFHLVTRDTADRAWRDAEALLDGADDELIAAAQRRLAAERSTGQRRMVALHGGRRDALVVHPNVWAGVGLLRGGAGTALVGSHDEVADRIAEYHRLGIDEFVLSGWPHDEQAAVAGRGLVPALRARGLLHPPVPHRSPLPTRS